MKIRMIVDSTADTTPEVAARLTVVPLTVCFGGQEYVHGVDITNTQFYEKLAEYALELIDKGLCVEAVALELEQQPGTTAVHNCRQCRGDSRRPRCGSRCFFGEK